MDTYNYIRDNYKKSVVSLALAVKECLNNPSDLMIDGLIQRFEFCTDYAIKSCGEYLDTAGHRIEGEPKDVFTKAEQIRLVENLPVWMKIVNDRRTTSNIYDHTSARRIAMDVQNEYLTVFLALSQRFS